MNLSHPITAITSPLTGRVLEALSATTKPLSAADVARLVRDGSRVGVWKALNRLAEQGIVLADERGSAVYYAANREHLAWAAVEQLTGLRTALREAIAAAILPWPVAPVHASLFGSAARGDADAASDVDLLLVRPDGLSDDDEASWDDQLDRLRDRVLRITGNRAQTLSLTPSRLEEHVRAGDPLVDAWRRDGILLAGAPLSVLLGGPQPAMTSL